MMRKQLRRIALIVALIMIVASLGTVAFAVDTPNGEIMEGNVAVKTAAVEPKASQWYVIAQDVHLRIGPGVEYRDVNSNYTLTTGNVVNPISYDYDSEGNGWRYCEVLTGALAGECGWIRATYVRYF